jgi:hypothetical protein
MSNAIAIVILKLEEHWKNVQLDRKSTEKQKKQVVEYNVFLRQHQPSYSAKDAIFLAIPSIIFGLS